MKRLKDLPGGWLLLIALLAYGVVTFLLGWALVPRTNTESWLRELPHLAAILLVVLAGSRNRISLPAATVLILLGLVVPVLRVKADNTSLATYLPYPVLDAALVAGCIGGGQLVARAIHSRNLLVPIGVVAGLIDPFGVYLGFTGQTIHYRPEAVAAASTSIPTVASMQVPFISVGPGDILFITIFLVCLYKFGLNVRGAVIWLFVAIGSVFGLLLLTPLGKYAFPGLPFIVAASLLPSAKAFSFSKEEKHAMLVGGFILLPLLIALVLFSRQIGSLLHWR